MTGWRCAAILFDLDGVLVDSRRCVESIWRTWAVAKGFDPEPFIRVAHGQRTSETLRSMAPQLDIAAETAALDRLEEVETAGVFVVPGATALIRSIPPGGWAIVTSGSHRVATRRIRAVSLPIPEVFVTAEAVRHGKPDPEGYLAAAAQLGLAPAECVVVEDSPPGIAAGRAAGMRVIALRTTHHDHELALADVRLPSLAVLKAAPDSRTGEIGLAWDPA